MGKVRIECHPSVLSAIQAHNSDAKLYLGVRLYKSSLANCCIL